MTAGWPEGRGVTRYREQSGAVVGMPAEPVAPAEDKPLPVRASAGDPGCPRCMWTKRAVPCPEHREYHAPVDVLKSAGIDPASREQGTWGSDLFSTPGVQPVEGGA